MKDFESRAKEAAKLYLTRRGYEIIDTIEHNACVFVCDDDGTFVFVELVTSEAAGDEVFADGCITRVGFEKMALRWFVENECELNRGFRFDVLSLTRASDDRALIRYHVAKHQEW